LGKKPVDLARNVHIGESYVSSLVSGKKKGTPTLLLEISEWLGITVNDLYRRPPSRDAVASVEEMTPAQIASLAQALENLERRKSR
jgi:transcriptional regulator with XRE-family HTH domain